MGEIIMKTSKLLTTVILIILLGYALILLYPYLFLIMGSLKPDKYFFTSILNFKELTINRYEQLLTAAYPFFRGLLNSFIVSGSVTTSILFFGALTAYAITKIDFKGRKIVSNFIIFQWIFGNIGVGFIIVYKMLVGVGLLNTYGAMILPYMMSAWSVFLFSQFFKTIPKSIIESARVEGASELRIIFAIVMPMSVSIATILGIYTFMGRWNELFWDLLVIRKPNMMTLNLLITNFVLGGGGADKPGLTFAATILLTFPLIMMFIIF